MLTSASNPCFIPAMASTELMALLKQTSRSFYLTLRVLPATVRPQIGLAYLLARTTDTIADTELVPVEKRLEALQKLRDRILGKSTSPLDFGELARQQGSPAEGVLLEKCEDTLSLLQGCFKTDQELIRSVLDVITSGQELDLKRFANASQKNIVALQSDAELDDYTYRVAGCVGEFWTRICRAELFPKPLWENAGLLADGVRFGKGLQLVNILRDLPADLSKGRCYMPADELSKADLVPADLLQPSNEPRFRPLYNRYLDMAEAHLAAGWHYTNTIPRSRLRMRLACAWPILIGIETTKRLRLENPLDAAKRIKINRAEVRAILLRTVVRYPLPGAWKNLFPQRLQATGKDVAPAA